MIPMALFSWKRFITKITNNSGHGDGFVCNIYNLYSLYPNQKGYTFSKFSEKIERGYKQNASIITAII